MSYSFSVSITGIIIENYSILLVKQKLSSARLWSLPIKVLYNGLYEKAYFSTSKFSAVIML